MRRCRDATERAGVEDDFSGHVFAAEIEIEPPHEVEFFTGDPLATAANADARLDLEAPACATAAVVTWRNGFEITHHDAPPTCRDNVPARFVQIDNRGQIQIVDRPITGGRTR